MDKSISKSQTKDELYQAFKRAEGLQRVTSLLAQAQTKKRVATVILNEGLTILDASNGEIDLLSKEKSLYVFAYKGYPREFVKKWPSIPKQIPTDTPLLIMDAIKSKTPLFLKDSNALPKKYEVGKSFFTTTKTRSGAIMPLMVKGESIGVLVFTFRKSQEFSKQKKLFMSTLANQCAQAFERITAQENLKESNRQLRELDQKKDDFISMASHELKTPLTSMKLFLDLIQRQLSSSKHSQESSMLLQKAQEQAERLQRLVNDFLDVSRIQQGKLTFLMEDFYLDTLVKDTIEGIVLPHKLQLTKVNKVKVRGDKFRIYQVITNLLTNANKYSPKDKPIHISVEKVDGDAVVSVKDFGTGIAKKDQKHIFEKLYQAKNKDKPTYSGLGMGLFISRGIITQHGGTIGVISEKGKGATFFFTLPLLEKE